ncbi:MAG: alanine racemase [Candidatus Paceibacterota bacterium]
MNREMLLAYIEISKSNLLHNLTALRALAKDVTKIVVAIKGNAYGHDQNIIAKILEPKVDYFFVNSALEFIELRKISKKRTFILGYVPASLLESVVSNTSILTFFSLAHLFEINNIARKNGVVQEVHMPIDAHLGREGFLENEWKHVLIESLQYKHIKLTGLYAHFANIEDTHNTTHATKQIRLFQKAIKLAARCGYPHLVTHISATSGLLVHEKNNGINPLVRIGIGVFGLWPSEHVEFLYKKKIKLLPVLSFKTRIVLIKELPPLHTVGYGLSYTTRKHTQVAVLPVGYADGIDRKLSNKGEVLIHGTRCPIIGRISMNMMTVDVSHLTEPKVGDEAVLLGGQKNAHIKAEEIATWAETINYEIVTRLSPLLPRVVV